MFNKKFRIFLITLVFMLSISTVAAFDTTVTDNLDTGDMEDEPPSGGVGDESLAVASDDDSNVLKVSASDISMYYKNGTRYHVTLSENGMAISNATVLISINGINYTKVTNDDGKASIGLNVNPGNYQITTIYNGVETTTTLEVLSTISAKDIVKIYKNGTQYSAEFLDNVGNPLTNTTVTFNINGIYYERNTNNNGIARLNINLISGKYVLTAIHPTGLMDSSMVTVLPSISSNNITKLYKNGTQYSAKFINNQGQALANTNVTFNINGIMYTRTTNDDGIAKLNINLIPGDYILTAINPINGEFHSSLVKVLPTISASDICVLENHINQTFNVELINGNGSPASNTTLNITIDGNVNSVCTDFNGIACLEFNLSAGTYEVVSTDPVTGLKIYNQIIVERDLDSIQYWSCYGVSPDGLTIMAIGRPSASGELSKYGYSFYKTILNRTCPYCGSHELYWGIFWADNETANYGVFPATGNNEGGSAEGHIFCADCDADWSIFGNNHGFTKNLSVISQSVSSSKDEAYALKNGTMIYS